VAGEPEVPSALFTTHHVRVQNGRAAIAKAEWAGGLPDLADDPGADGGRAVRGRARTFCMRVRVEHAWSAPGPALPDGSRIDGPYGSGLGVPP
jgi:hypothetical protein